MDDIKDTAVVQDTPIENEQVTEKKTPVRKGASKKATPKNSPAESGYSVADLARAARKRFGVPPEIVTAAMRVAGKDKATVDEMMSIIEAFMAREVK